ncbi:MAG: hypothetical protein AB2809_06710 [Candidatus Thiodiazotropha sp.]
MKVEENKTAINEVGNATANARLGIGQGLVTIIPNAEKEFLDSVHGEGADHAFSREQAENQVMSYCAGYAALIEMDILWMRRYFVHTVILITLKKLLDYDNYNR